MLTLYLLCATYESYSGEKSVVLTDGIESSQWERQRRQHKITCINTWACRQGHTYFECQKGLPGKSTLSSETRKNELELSR